MGPVKRATLLDLQKAVNTDGSVVDVYRVAAAKRFGVPYESVDEAQRSAAKRAYYHHLYTPTGRASHVD